MPKMLAAGFSNLDEANAVINELAKLGYEKKDFSIITSETRDEDWVGNGHTVGEGAASGAATGTVIGGVAGLLAGAGVIPALAGLLFGGPIAAALGATGLAAATISGAVTGAAAGGLIGALTHLGVPEEAARSYEEIIKEGGTMLGVPVEDDEQAEDVRAVFAEHGATTLTEFDMRQ